MRLPVRIRGTDSNGKPFVQSAHTLDISQTGARLEWVAFIKGTGVTVELEHGNQRARFRVMWIGGAGTSQEGQIGVQRLDPVNNFWEPSLPKQRMGPPAATPRIPFVASWTGNERRKDARYTVCGGLELYEEQTGARLAGRITDVSLGGCYVEMMTPLPVESRAALVLRANDLELRAKGEVRISHPGMGMGLAFTEMDAEDHGRLQQLIRCLAAGKTPRATATALRDQREGPMILRDGPETAATFRNAPEAPAFTPSPALVFELLLRLLQEKGVLTAQEVSRALETFNRYKQAHA